MATAGLVGLAGASSYLLTGVVGARGALVAPAPLDLAPAGFAPQAAAPAEAVGAVAVADAGGERAPAGPAAPPVFLRLDAIGVAAPVVGVGVTEHRAMEVPAELDRVGWYRLGPAPGSPGAAVIAAHVDAWPNRAGAFYRLRELAPGATVAVVDADGHELRFRVTELRTYDKAKLPVHELFQREGPATLHLVTCSGAFDRSARSYAQNLVVTAVPLDEDHR
ncbi:MAG: class F sortase [Acidimicrobiales bacterium]